MTTPKDKTVRVNLGCGRKLLPLAEGWINVDVIDPPEIVLDTVAQISAIPFDPREINEKTQAVFHAADIKHMHSIATGSVHEVHAYHVLEHFEVAELPAVMAEIRRILHPEIGAFVCEQPNVIKCAKNFLQIETTKNPDVWYRLGLQGFYGDIEPGNVYSYHKWGWWPESLAEQLLKLGFKTVVPQEAKTHMGEQRDFRLVAFMDKVPENINVLRAPQAAASPLVTQKAQPSKGIGLKNQATGKDEPLMVTPMDSVAQPHLLDNIQNNLNTIPNWLSRAKVHTGKAIIASAGPSLKRHLTSIKERQAKGEVVFCVKHSLPTLVAAGINPEFCVILDPRPLDGISTHGVKRKDLFEVIPNDTTMLVASMTDFRVTKYLMEKKANIVGWHALANGIDKFYNTGKIDLLVAGGTCSAMRAINIAYNLGFRELDLIGFDCSMDKGWTPSEEDLKVTDERQRPKYIEIFYKDASKKFYSTGELVAQAQDIIACLENPNDITFNMPADSNYAGEIWKDFEARFKPLPDFNVKKVSK